MPRAEIGSGIVRWRPPYLQPLEVTLNHFAGEYQSLCLSEDATTRVGDRDRVAKSFVRGPPPVSWRSNIGVRS